MRVYIYTCALHTINILRSPLVGVVADTVLCNLEAARWAGRSWPTLFYALWSCRVYSSETWLISSREHQGHTLVATCIRFCPFSRLEFWIMGNFVCRFVWLIISIFSLILNQHQLSVTTQAAVFFSHNKSIPVTSHSQTNRVNIGIC